MQCVHDIQISALQSCHRHQHCHGYQHCAGSHLGLSQSPWLYLQTLSMSHEINYQNFSDEVDGNLGGGQDKLCRTRLAAPRRQKADGAFVFHINTSKQGVKSCVWLQSDPLSFGFFFFFLIFPPNRFTYSQTSATNVVICCSGAEMWGYSEGKQCSLGLCASKHCLQPGSLGENNTISTGSICVSS